MENEKLSLKDLKILSSLYSKTRKSLTQIAKEVRISKELVSYTLKKLQKKGVLLKVIPVLNYSLLGYSLYKIHISLNKEGLAKEQEIIEDLQKKDYVTNITSLEGRWNLSIFIISESVYNFYLSYNYVLKTYGEYVIDKSFSIVGSIDYSLPNNILPSSKMPVTVKEIKEKVEISTKEKIFLKYLSENARESLVAIGKKSGIPATTLSYMLKNLHKKKVILGYKPILNFEKIGFAKYKVVLSLYKPAIFYKLKEFLLSIPAVTTVIDIIGNNDLEFECEFANILDLMDLLKQIDKIAIIKEKEIIFDNKELIINDYLVLE